MDTVDLAAIGGVQREVMKPGCGAVMRWRVAALAADGSEDQPLSPGRGVAPLPRSPAVAARDLHPAELGQERVVETLTARGVTNGET